MNIVELSDSVGVAGQISAADVETIAAAGYRVLVNNRPDGEEGGQPPGEDIAAAAAIAGLEYHYMPVTHTSFPGDDFDAFTALLDDARRPVLAFCRTGTRCTNLWVASREAGSRAGAAQRARELGFDLGMASAWLGEALQ